MAENNERRMKVRRVLTDNPLYKVVETESGDLLVLTGEHGPMSAFANIQTTQILHHRVEQLEKVNSITGLERQVLDEALTQYRLSIIKGLAGVNSPDQS